MNSLPHETKGKYPPKPSAKISPHRLIGHPFGKLNLASSTEMQFAHSMAPIRPGGGNPSQIASGVPYYLGPTPVVNIARILLHEI